jgi:hypothetical protein
LNVLDELQISAVRGALCGVSCCIGAYPPAGKVSHIPAHASMPSLLLPARNSLHRGAAAAFVRKASQDTVLCHGGARNSISISSLPVQNRLYLFYMLFVDL